ncbi:MAG: thiamine pyrophosphate-binding protein [Desulfobacteraceae bacterium]|nr:thiamine pyrophosphate-binding protein [Desulfobacteraceae bacterium]
MRKTGARLTVYALEKLPVRHTFGIPGVHVTELYDELSRSKKIRPVLVTHEAGAAFMADALSRTTDHIGVLVIVPAAGVTHAMSGIGEAFLAGIPMLVISGGVRRDCRHAYQLHDLDLQHLMEPITKQSYLIRSHQDIVSTLFEAYSVAVSGEPGPVFVEIPADILLFKGDAGHLPAGGPVVPLPPAPDRQLIHTAANLLRQARKPGMFLGWGSRDCPQYSMRLAELLQAPVATTLQGLSVFPANHPLHTGMGFSNAAVPAAENAFAGCDCLLAAGTRFSEIPTGGYGVKVPENLIHIDINPMVFHKNYTAKVAIEAEAGAALQALLENLQTSPPTICRQAIESRIASDKLQYLESWRSYRTDKINPALFFDSLRKQLASDAITIADDGNHTFLCAELLTNIKSKHFISPSDFNCMGYCVPAVIGAKLANPGKTVVGIVGDGGFLMTCMEILTASTENLGVVYFVFYDGELAQIAQGQKISYNRKTCTIIGKIGIEGVADAVGATYLNLKNNEQIDGIITQALAFSKKNMPVIVDVKIDYSKRTRFTRGVVNTVSSRFPLGEKVRFIGRALMRKATG